ncbi:PDDEXK-like family protein [Psychroserpens ponticola]|uniref:PD-(D/E)XK nuclease family protein n=1 Tax=Psychroserpens ponticola TaxID=2932268 RepID=A0ABY7S4T9_9FLAO|nr:PD-(D/E)XK nuclease family protein [Psychroserpens ponticola]WCO03421.1 PD-(D/E)XK nuclease family protein [Psychroserpens ponticola]
MSVSVEDLENFIIKTQPDLETIKRELSAFNIFNVLGIQHREIRHSNFLGWLFDPNESHQLGDALLKTLLQYLSKLDAVKGFNLGDLLNKDLSSTQVYRESVHNIDILIVNEQLGFVITIENKIFSDFSEHQLAKYYKYIELNYSHLKTRVYLTLTPNESNRHIGFNLGDMYININYKNIVTILKANKQLIDASKPTVKESISQYISMVQKDITKTSKEVALAKKLYKNYKKEIDFIISNQEDFSVYKKDILNYFNGGGFEGFIISHNSENRNVIFLLPDNEDLLELFRYPEAESRGGEFIFSLVIYFEKDVVWMKFGFGNIVESIHKGALQEKKDALFNTMKGFECFKNKKLSIDHHNHNSSMEFAGICGVQLFDDDMYYSENTSFLEIFKMKFEVINRELIQPWIKECLEKIS